MAENIIYVKRNGNSYELKLRDNQGNNPGNNKLETKVDPDDKVKWQLDENSGLSEITGIRESDSSDPKYRNSQNLLAGPAIKNNGIWEANVVSRSPGKDKFENYMVGFKVPGDDTEYWDDPKLIMKI